MNEEMKTVQISQEEYLRLKELEAREKKTASQKAEREAYREIADKMIAKYFSQLVALSEDMQRIKSECLEEFREVIKTKIDMFGLKSDQQRSHTFTHSGGHHRLTIGVRTTDGYHDTAADGELIIREELEKLGDDDKSRSLIKTILRLLAKDNKGSLKPAKVIELRQLAEELKNDRILEGVKVIEESYIPSVSKMYIKIEERKEDGGWLVIPLSVTEVQERTDAESVILGVEPKNKEQDESNTEN